MRSVVWIVILFAVAVGLALASGVYTTTYTLPV